MLGMEGALLKWNVIFQLFHFHTGLLVLGVIRFGVEYPMYLGCLVLKYMVGDDVHDDKTSISSTFVNIEIKISSMFTHSIFQEFPVKY
jgi:hypothetical protein